jgi:hypothetical protein
MVLNELHGPVRPTPPPKPKPDPINWSDKLSGAQKAADTLNGMFKIANAFYNAWQAAQMANRMGQGGFARPIPWVRPVPAIEV